jgi:hypothetical protein
MPSTPIQIPETKARISLRRKYSPISKPRSRHKAQRFNPEEEAGYKLVSYKVLPKGKDWLKWNVRKFKPKCAPKNNMEAS